jgi:hypothetical protein
VDDALTGEILRVLQPGAVEAAVMAHEEASQAADEVLAALQRDLEGAGYAGASLLGQGHRWIAAAQRAANGER